MKTVNSSFLNRRKEEAVLLSSIQKGGVNCFHPSVPKTTRIILVKLTSMFNWISG